MNQMVKTNDVMRKLRQPTGETKKNSNKMAGSNSHITILTSNVNGLNAPIERVRSQKPSVCCIQETQAKTHRDSK